MDKITRVGQKDYSKTKQCQEVVISLICGAGAARRKGKKGLIVSLDMKKAFDSLSHNYMDECLKFFGFGEYIRKWLQIIGTNRAACIELTKNKITGSFDLSRGNAQGDIISPFLFNIGYQLLVLKLEKDADLRGFYDFPEDTVLRGMPVPVNISRSQRKMFAFADDGNLLIEATAENLIRLKKILGDFKELSGLECNIEKSVMLQVGDNGNLPGEVIL
jgi:hypothetical protein